MPETAAQFDFDQPFEEALEYFRQKGWLFSPDSWKDLDAEAHARAFTIAKVAAFDILRDVKEALEASEQAGETLADFMDRLPGIMNRKGWTGEKGAWRLATVFRTNLATAYNVGRYKQQQENKEQRPYWQYRAVMDPSTRPEHAKMHGKTYRADDPVWHRWYPPNGFSCRCVVKTLSPSQVESLGLEVRENNPPMIDGLPVQPDEGWNYNVGEKGLDAWKPALKKYTPEDRKLLAAILKEIIK